MENADFRFSSPRIGKQRTETSEDLATIRVSLLQCIIEMQGFRCTPRLTDLNYY